MFNESLRNVSTLDKAALFIVSISISIKWKRLEKYPLFQREQKQETLNNTHRENGDALGMVPLMINPIYTLYSGY